MAFRAYRRIRFERRAYVYHGNNRTECAALVQQTTHAPKTRYWRAGLHVRSAKPGEIERYTAIATFDERGRYPGVTFGRHAALYLRQNSMGIFVIDQWGSKETPSRRFIRFHGKEALDPSNNGDFFYVIETEFTRLQKIMHRQGAELV